MALVDTFDDAAKQEWSGKGYDKLEGDELVRALWTERSALSKQLGADAGDVLRLSDSISSDPKRVAEFWNKLGTPTDPKGYDLSAVKFKDGTGLEESFQAAVREAAYKSNMPASLVSRFMAEMAPFMEQQAEAQPAQEAANQIANDGALLQAWKGEAGANKLIVERAMNTLKESTGTDMGPALLALAKVMDGGYVAAQNLFLGLGKMMGEGRYVGGGGAGPSNTARGMSPEQAQAQRQALMNDGPWVKRWLDGGSEERRQMENLITVIAGGR